MDEATEIRLQLRREFTDFLDHDFGSGTYVKRIEAALESSTDPKAGIVNDVRLEVDVQDVQDYQAALHARLLSDPAVCIPPFEDAVLDVIKRSSELSKQLQPEQKIHVALAGEFGPQHLSPRQLNSANINQLVEVYGIVTKVSSVRPKMAKSVHYAEATEGYTTREYRDATSLTGMPTGSALPTRDQNDNLLTTVFGCCEFTNHQTVVIQELPETAPAGQLPRSTDIVLEADLVNRCKPGDRIAVVGVYKAMAGKVSGVINGTFRSLVVASNLKQLRHEVETSQYTSEDIDNIYELAQSEGWLAHLAQSIAPSIYGYETIKKALVLLLLGGREHNLANGTHLRGDINCLLIGDPGVAKSQMLRAVMNIAPLAVSTTGRGSSGVGLTAAVTTNSDTGEKQLEAGAMVLADRGLVCIDEFDKMNDNDRVAVHEVMEQQTVTIAKAGIHTSLHARCSVLAAANPLYGTYDHSLSVTKNINLPDSLLSRFDLLFVVLDNMDANRDKAIAEHVVHQHLYRAPGDDGRTALHESTDYRFELDAAADKAEGGSDVYVKYDPRLYGPKSPGQRDPLAVPFMKKFFHYAKRRFSNSVALTPEANELIADYYTELRASGGDRALPITVRTLETIIRLATAHAKCRLSKSVDEQDVEVAREILDEVMASSSGGGQAEAAAGGGWESRARRAGAKRAAREDDGDSGDEEGDDGGDDDMGEGAPGADGADDMDAEENDENRPPSAAAAGSQAAKRSGTGRSSRGGNDAAQSALPGIKQDTLQAVQDEVRAMLQDRSGELQKPLDGLKARLQQRGVWASEAELEKVLTFLQLEADEGRSDLPIMYVPENKSFYDLS